MVFSAQVLNEGSWLRLFLHYPPHSDLLQGSGVMLSSQHSSGESSWGRSTEGDCTETAPGMVSSRGRKHLHSEAHVCVSGVGWGVGQSVSQRSDIFPYEWHVCCVFCFVFVIISDCFLAV